MQIWTLREFNHSKYCMTLEFLPYFCSAHSNSSSALIQKLAAAGSFMPWYSLLRSAYVGSASGVVSVGMIAPRGARRSMRARRDLNRPFSAA